MLEEKEELGFFIGLKIFVLWVVGKIVEIVYFVRDNYKFKEMVYILGVCCLYFRFDSRCFL